MKDHAQYEESLALYALDALDDAQEVAGLEAHLQECAECRNELESLRGDAGLLALSAVGPAPPQRARQRLMEAVRKEPRLRRAPRRQVIGVLTTRWFALVPVAAVLLLVSFSLLILRENSRLRRNVEYAENDLRETRRRLQEVQSIADLLQAPDAQHATLVAMKTRPQPQVKTIYSPGKQRLLLVAGNLEALPADKVYELWLLPANGAAPVPAGTFRPDASGNAVMDHPMTGSLNAKAFAITIEPAGGSLTPTMPIMMMSTG